MLWKKEKHTNQKKKRILSFNYSEKKKNIIQISAETGIYPTVLARWKAEAIENLPSLFTRGASEVEKMRKQYEAEKEELTKQIGQLTIEVNWLKKIC